jgi:hypothetical protein
MKCPYCPIEMQKGCVYMKGTILGYFFLGIPYKNLFFREDKSKEKRLIIRNREIVPAYYCKICGSILLHNPVFDAGENEEK